MSNSPTIRMETTTVSAVTIARIRLHAVTGRPAARANSSSLLTANIMWRSPTVTNKIPMLSTANVIRSDAVVVVSAPKR